jgi:hypothetical protein
MKLQLTKETSSAGTIFYMIYKDGSIESCIYAGNENTDTEETIQEAFNRSVIRFAEIKNFKQKNEKKELIFEETI